MSKFIIDGGGELKGEIPVAGAKNAALKIIPASLLSKQPITIKNLPKIEDIGKALEILKNMGAQVRQEKNCVIIDNAGITAPALDPSLANKFRASVMFVGPLLARFGEITFPHPGGCVIGAGGRPIDIFLDGFQAMGAEVIINERSYTLKAKKLKGCKFFFPKIAVTATEAMMMTACLAEGTTVLENAAMEPEIPALADYLNKQGARIKGAGTPTITIEGVKELQAGEFTIIPDRIETGSFAIMAAATRSEITITDCIPDHVRILLKIFDRIGVPYLETKDSLTIKPAKKIRPYSIQTHEYPGFATDLQSPYTLLMTQAEGKSLIHETIYDRRLLFVDLLMQMGADIILCDPHRVVVNGPSKLFAKKLVSPDLRAGITLVIAALIAEGQTEIGNIYQIDRGYEDIDRRLKQLGAKITRIDTLKL